MSRCSLSCPEFFLCVLGRKRIKCYYYFCCVFHSYQIVPQKKIYISQERFVSSTFFIFQCGEGEGEKEVLVCITFFFFLRLIDSTLVSFLRKF